MANNAKKPGFIYQSFNIGFTVLMFITPTILLGYWYFYIRQPQQQQVKVVTNQPIELKEKEPADPPPAKNETNNMPSFFSVGGSTTPAIQSVESQTEQQTAKPEKVEYEARTWSDASGKFSVKAKFASMTTDSVTLLTSDGRKITVPINKLGEDDVEYLRDVLRAKGFKPSF